MSVQIMVTRPPTANALYRNEWGGGRRKTVAYQRWLHLAGQEILLQRPLPTFAGPVSVCFEWGPNRNKDGAISGVQPDTDNLPKPLNDLLTKMQLWHDDKQVRINSTSRRDDIPPRQVRITIEGL